MTALRVKVCRDILRELKLKYLLHMGWDAAEDIAVFEEEIKDFT